MLTAVEVLRLAREAYSAEDRSYTRSATGTPQGGQFATGGGTQTTGPAPKPAAKPAPKPVTKKPVAKPAAKKPPTTLEQASTRLYADFGTLSERTPANDSRVRDAQVLMASLGMKTPIDGNFGPAMTAQVKAMQTKLGIHPTGRMTSSLMKKLQSAAILSPCAKAVEGVTFTAADLLARAREGFNPDQLRAEKGTGIGGRWVSMRAVVAALRGKGHHDAADSLGHLDAPAVSGHHGPTRRPASHTPKITRGGDRVGAEHLSARLGVLNDEHGARQHDGSPMADPEARRRNRLQADQLHATLAPMQGRVVTEDAIAADNRETRNLIGDVPEGDHLAAARAHVAAMQGGAPAAPSAEPLSAEPATRAAQVDNRVRAAYAHLAAKPGDWVGLADLRNELGEDVNRHEVDASLKRFLLADGSNVVPESNQKTLTQADRDAAVSIGDQAKHAIMIEDPSPRPLSLAAPSTPDARASQVDDRIRAAYSDLAKGPTERVSISKLRASVGSDVSREEFDASMLRFGRGKDSYLETQEAQRNLTPQERADAVHIGSRDYHFLLLDQNEMGPKTYSTDGGGRISQEEAGRRMFGDAEYERRAAKTAARKAAAKAAPAKAPAEPGASGVSSYDSRKVDGQWGVYAIAPDGSSRLVEPAGSEGAANNRAGNMDAALGDRRAERAVAPAPVPTAPAEKTAARKLTAGQILGMSPDDIQQAHAEGRVSSGVAARRLRELANSNRQHAAIRGGSTVNPSGESTQAAQGMRDRADALERIAAEIEAKPAKKTAAAKMTRAKASVDHASVADQVKAAQSEDDVRRLLQEQKLTVADLKTIAGHVGGPSANPKGTKQQIIDKIAAGSNAGLVNRPATVFAGDWNRAATTAPSTPSVPTAISPEEAKRRADILAAPRGEARAMRPEDGAGVFSADSEIQRRSASALNAESDASRANGVRAVELENDIKAAGAKLSRQGSLVSLSDLRDELGDRYSREEVDRGLQLINRTSAARVVPASYQGELSQKEHDAHVMIGNQRKHFIAVDDATPSALPVQAGPTPSRPTAAQKMAQAKAAAEPPEATQAKLAGAGSREEAHALLAGMTVSQLRALNPAAGKAAKNKADLIDLIVNYTVGSRLDRAALNITNFGSN